MKAAATEGRELGCKVVGKEVPRGFRMDEVLGVMRLGLCEE